jgi:hypothetical protein
MWVNAGEQQFHLPKAKAQIFRGHIAIALPDLDDLKKRFKFIAKPMADTLFAWEERDDYIAVTCPWGNQIRAYGPGKFSNMDLGIPYIDMQVPPDTTAGIARFYEQVMGCSVVYEPGKVRVQMGYNQELIFSETDEAIADYDGHHIAVYVSNFSGPHKYLAERQLISEESDQHQYRFQYIVDPQTGTILTELEHEVRSMSHAMRGRPLVNRNPAVNFFTYKKGNERFSTA